jgi:excinuclease ABC subunit C
MDQNDIKNLNLPSISGVYLYKNKTGKIIYIGKAANLKSRVSSYWRESADLTPAKVEMLKAVEKIEWIETDTEIEALLLEANLVKKFQPYYNILLRDDKRHAYIKVSTEEEWPRVFATRQVDKAGKYFGPFTSGEAVRETLKIVRRIWPYRTCRNLPKRACLYYSIGKCPGMCEERISHSDYLKTIKQISLFLEGKKKKIIFNFQFSISNFRKKVKRKNIKFNEKEKIEQEINLLERQLKNIAHILSGSRIISVGEKYANDVVELAKIFNLAKVPQRIEGYDISNIFGRDAVGSMVVFSGGEPDKKEYRKFKIKIKPGEANDVGMLKEVLARRFEHLIAIDKLPIFDKKIKFWGMPDLIVVDGGKAQLNVILKILKSYKLIIPVVGITKGEGLRSAGAPDKLFFPGEKKPLELPLASPALHLIKRVRDEAHRFAIGYHKNLRAKRFFNRS